MIPHVIHQIWVGDAQIPQECAHWARGWRDLHPGWIHLLWTDTMVEQVLDDDELQCRQDYLAATEPAMKADILRYELLYAIGGVYVDIDVEPQRPIDDIINVDAFVPLEDHTGPWFGNAVLGSEAGHPFFKRVLERVPDSITTNWMKPVNERTGPVFLSKVWHAAEGIRPTVFPREWFFPYSHTEKHLRGQLFPDAYGIHHWLNTWEGR